MGQPLSGEKAGSELDLVSVPEARRGDDVPVAQIR
jgi:hypothetical protein